MANEDNDPIQELLEICDKAPKDGLSFIEGLDEETRKDGLVMFGRFIALRKLAFAKFIQAGETRIAHKDAAGIKLLFDEEHIKWAREALQQIAQIAAEQPDYLDDLLKKQFAISMVDDICTVMERLDPGIVQKILGWTKLRYFGTKRIGVIPGFKEDEHREALSKAIEIKFSLGEIARSAVCLNAGRMKNGAHFAEFFLYELNFKETETIGDAHCCGTIKIAEDGNFEYKPDDQAKPVSKPSPALTKGPKITETLRGEPIKPIDVVIGKCNEEINQFFGADKLPEYLSLSTVESRLSEGACKALAQKRFLVSIYLVQQRIKERLPEINEHFRLYDIFKAYLFLAPVDDDCDWKSCCMKVLARWREYSNGLTEDSPTRIESDYNYFICAGKLPFPENVRRFIFEQLSRLAGNFDDDEKAHWADLANSIKTTDYNFQNGKIEFNEFVGKEEWPDKEGKKSVNQPKAANTPTPTMPKGQKPGLFETIYGDQKQSDAPGFRCHSCKAELDLDADEMKTGNFECPDCRSHFKSFKLVEKGTEGEQKRQKQEPNKGIVPEPTAPKRASDEPPQTKRSGPTIDVALFRQVLSEVNELIDPIWGPGVVMHINTQPNEQCLSARNQVEKKLEKLLKVGSISDVQGNEELFFIFRAYSFLGRETSCMEVLHQWRSLGGAQNSCDFYICARMLPFNGRVQRLIVERIAQIAQEVQNEKIRTEYQSMLLEMETSGYNAKDAEAEFNNCIDKKEAEPLSNKVAGGAIQLIIWAFKAFFRFLQWFVEQIPKIIDHFSR